MGEHQTSGNQGTAPQSGLVPSSFNVRPSAAATRTEQDLHVCPDCASNLVYPVDWAPAAGRRWTVDLRCPECEWEGAGVYDQAVVDRFDEELDKGTESMVEDLKLLARANMEDEIDRFVDALRRDLILPEDF